MGFKKDKIIIGGGITGLVCLEYFKDYCLIEGSRDLATDFLDDSLPKYFHYDESTEKFFKKIGFNPSIGVFDVRILYNDMTFNFGYCGDDKREIYEKYCIKKYGKVIENKMNGFMTGKRSHYVKNKKELVDLLYERNKDRIILNSKVNNISKNALSTNFFTANCKSIISTMPYHITLRLLNNKHHDYIVSYVDSYIVKFIIVESQDPHFYYVVDDRYKCNRINFHGNVATFEFPVHECDSGGKKKIKECVNILREKYLFYCGEPTISFNTFEHSTEEIRELNGIKLIGRYAQMDYCLKLNDIIKKLEERYYG